MKFIFHAERLTKPYTKCALKKKVRNRFLSIKINRIRYRDGNNFTWLLFPYPGRSIAITPCPRAAKVLKVGT